MIYVLMTDEGEPDYHDSFIALFTDKGLLEQYVIEHPVPEPMSYYMLESIPDHPGVARRVDLAVLLESEITDITSVIEGSPIQHVGYQGVVSEGELAPPIPFSIEVFDHDHRSLLKVFETSAGQLEAQFKPGDLTEACETFVRELQRLQLGASGAS